MENPSSTSNIPHKIKENMIEFNKNEYEKILERGFTINYDLDNKIITSKRQAKSKEKFKIIFKDGKKFAIFE